MMETLSQVSDGLATIVEEQSPVVVRVEARRRLPASGIAWSSDGVVVTAHHVVEQEDDIKVGLHDGSVASATLVGRDPTTDVAVLRADGASLAPPVWAEPDDVRVGNLALALGRPGLSVMATLGVVSALGERWRTPTGGRIDRYVQTDVAMYPGFSGGPLVDGRGRVLGVNTSALLRGMSLVVPRPTLARVVEALLAHGRVRRGYLGVGTQVARLPEGLAGELGQETGLLLVSVEPGSPAEKAGLLLGDTLVALDGQRTREPGDLLAQLSGDRIGQSASGRIVRGGVIQELSVVVGERPE